MQQLVSSRCAQFIDLNSQEHLQFTVSASSGCRVNKRPKKNVSPNSCAEANISTTVLNERRILGQTIKSWLRTTATTTLRIFAVLKSTQHNNSSREPRGRSKKKADSLNWKLAINEAYINHVLANIQQFRTEIIGAT